MSAPVAALVKYNPCSVHARRGIACSFFISGKFRQCGKPYGFCDSEYDGWLKDVIQGKTKCFYPRRIRLLEIPGMILMVYHVEKKAIIGEAKIVRATHENNRHYYWFDQFLLYPNPISLRLLRADPQLAERGMRVVKYISQETVDEIRELSGLKGESKERLKRELELAKVEAERRRSSLLTKNSFSLTLEHKRLTEHGVEREILEGAQEIFLQAIKLTRRKYSKYIFYSSLYIAYRLSGIPISIKEIQSMGKLEPKRLVSTIRSLMESLKIRLPQAKPKELIFHNSKKLGVPQEIIQSAIDFAIIMGNTKHIRTKSPRSIAATALYLAFQQANRKITQKEIAAAFNVSDVTIRNLRKMWLVHSGQFIQKRS